MVSNGVSKTGERGEDIRMTLGIDLHGTRLLSEDKGKIPYAVLGPINNAAIEDRAVSVEYRNVLTYQVIGIFLDSRDRVLAQDTRRNGPGWINHQVFDLCPKARRFPEGCSNHGFGIPQDLLIINEIHMKAGNIHHQEGGRNVVQEPAHAFQVDADLIDAR